MTEARVSPIRDFIKGVPITVWLMVLVLVPLLFTVLMSVYSTNGMVIERHFNLDNYKKFFTDPLYGSILLKTFKLAIIVTAFSLAAGYPLAYLVSFKVRRGRNLLFMMSIIPLWVSYLVRLIAWRTILGNHGVLNGFLVGIGVIPHPLRIFLYNQFAMTIALVYICIPFVFIPCYTAMEKIPRNLVDAANDLGASEWRTFTSVILPLSLPGLVSGFIFSFIIPLGDYIIPQQLGGPNGMMFGNLVWSQFGFAFNWPFGAVLGLVLLAISVIILGVTANYGSTEGFLGE